MNRNSDDRLLYFKSFQNSFSYVSFATAARYIEENNESIQNKILNGLLDIQKSSLKVLIDLEQINQKAGGKDFQKILRRKFIREAEQQKQKLSKKLDYLQNSISILKKQEELQSKSSLRVSYSMGSTSMRGRQWKSRIKERENTIQLMKAKILYSQHLGEDQLNEIQQDSKEDEKKRRKEQSLRRIFEIEERAKYRLSNYLQRKKEYQIAKKKIKKHEQLESLFRKKQYDYQESKKKKRLAEIRALHQSVTEVQIRQHQQSFLQIRKQKQSTREREKKMKLSRQNSQRPMYESFFYKVAKQQYQYKAQNYGQIRSGKQKKYSQKVKQLFSPNIDKRKREAIAQIIEKEAERDQKKIQKDENLQGLSRQRGLEYLQLQRQNKIKGLNEVKKEKKKQEQDKRVYFRYQNYLIHNKRVRSQYEKILESQEDKERKVLKLQYLSEKMDAELKRKEIKDKWLRIDSSDYIDEQYYSMVKAKLNLLLD